MLNNKLVNYGRFVIKIGNMWVREEYGTYRLEDNPITLLSYKQAKEIQKKTGGTVIGFVPVEIDKVALEFLENRLQKEDENA